SVMSSPSPAMGPKEFHFKRNVSLLNQNGSLGFEASADLQPDVLAALAGDTEFPLRDIELAEFGLKANTPNPIEFARGADKISFTASGGVFAGLGVYHTGGALLAKIGDKAADLSLQALEFGDLDKSVLSILRWGYSAEGKVSGAMALGPIGKATLGVSGNAEGLFAVIRRLPSSTHARDLIQE